MESMFRCPLCASPLERGNGAYACPRGHSFDISREGYVHLLPANQKHSKAPGDDKEMAAARSRFLSAGYYIHLREALEQLALQYAGDTPRVLDSGCGEGYYTAGIHDALAAAGRSVTMAGVDISKFCLRWAARRTRDVEFAVASAYHLPLEDGSADLLVNCFSPLAADEFRRVLVPGGVFLYVVPAADHLWELKEVLYDRPYRNPEEAIPYEGFDYLDIVKAGKTIIPRGQDLADLFRMTPYYWKTPKEGGARLSDLEELTVRANFCVHVFRRR